MERRHIDAGRDDTGYASSAGLRDDLLGRYSHTADAERGGR